MTTANTFHYGVPSEGDSIGNLGLAGSDQYGSEDQSKSPLDRLGFAKFLSSEKKTRDGQTPKRRGPKPDSKPALTRRQELNRQAQRTHRERKELYIKALEAEVLRLKEVYGDTVKERDNATHERELMAAEIRRLKDILASHGIAHDAPQLQQSHQSTYASSSTGSHIGSSYRAGTSSTGYTSPPQLSGQGMGSPPESMPLSPQQGLNYDQIGIDFVLALERPCMDHMQMLMVRSSDSEAEISGHAMMASCPPESHIVSRPNEAYPHQMPDMGMKDLLKLLDLSNRLPLDGEITPIMAWAGIYSHGRRNELTGSDFENLKNNLKAKVRCYGFGAVLEEFEVRDAVTNVLASKEIMSAEELALQFSIPPKFENQDLYVTA